jgi:hypothetical protein
VLLVAHRLTRIPARGAALRIALGDRDAAAVELRFELRAADATPLEPDAAGPWAALVADAELVLGDRHGVRVENRGPGSASLFFSS